MARRRQSLTTAFFLIQIIMTISTYDVVLGVRSSSASAVGLLRLVRSVRRDSARPNPDLRRPPPSDLDDHSLLADHLGNHGDDGRPVFGALNLRSMDNFDSDPDNYWDFVLGSGTFKRDGGGNGTSDESTSGTRLPLFDVLARKMKENGGPNDAHLHAAAATEVKAARNLQSGARKKKLLGDDFFPSTSNGNNHDFYDFLLGEHGR